MLAGQRYRLTCGILDWNRQLQSILNDVVYLGVGEILDNPCDAKLYQVTFHEFLVVGIQAGNVANLMAFAAIKQLVISRFITSHVNLQCYELHMCYMGLEPGFQLFW